MTIKVFLADDHAVVRDGMKALLEGDHDITVVGIASNGRDAVRQVQKFNPDVVVMDIAMPELNGIEATARICEASPSIRVIILSMHDTSEHIFQALKAGAMGYLIKESAGKEVITAVRTVHSGRRYLSQKIEEKVIENYIDYRKTAPDRSPLDKLSLREREILQLVVEGKSSAMIAESLFLSPKTIETYRSRLMQKLDIKDLPSLVKFAIQHGITSIET
jgi:DNA-binding NarL/FixJ family response regulator